MEKKKEKVINKVKRVFTFGSGQPHENKYHIIFGENEEDCRKQMFERFGKKWSMMYKTEKDAGVVEYNLIELK